MAGTSCLVCSDNFIVKTKFITCKLCDKRYHLHCVKLKDQLYKNLQENENVFWFCDTCIPEINSKLKNKSEPDILSETLEKTKEILSVLSENLKCNNSNNKRLYSDVLNNNNLIIKPRNVQDSRATKTEVIKKINPSDISASIRTVKEINKGSVIISCEDKKSLDKLKNCAQNELGENYMVETVNKKPKIKIVNVEEDVLNDENFLKSVKMQNLLSDDIEMKMVYKYKAKKDNCYTAIMEVPGCVFGDIIKKGRLYVGWKWYAVYEHVSVLRCFNCWRYGHKTDKCDNSKTCPICNGPNCNKRECNANKKECTNCKYAHDHLNLFHIDFNHTVFDKNCASQQKQIQRVKSRVSYL